MHAPVFAGAVNDNAVHTNDFAESRVLSNEKTRC